MPEYELDGQGQVRASQAAFRVLEVFSGAARVAFDRVLAARAIGEAERAIPGDDWSTWSRRLVEVGESLNLRIRSIESSVADALTLVGQGVPVVTSVPGAGTTDEPRWILLAEARRGRARMVSLNRAGDDQWIRERDLSDRLGLGSPQEPCRWVLGQPALACAPPGEHDGHSGRHGHLPPLKRLIHLLRPEKQDLWIVLVFSIVVGILALASPVAVEALVNTVAFGRYLQPVVVLAVFLFVFLAFAAALSALVTLVAEVLQRRLFVRVVQDLAYRLPRVQQQAFDTVHGPELVNRFFDVANVQKALSGLLLDGVAVVLQTVIGMAVLAFYHPFLLGFDIVLLVMIALIIFGLGRGAVNAAIRESRAKYAVGAWLEELARHPTAFKLNAGTQFALDRADQLTFNWLDARRTHFRIVMRQIVFALGLHAVAATALLGLGGWLVISGELTLGQLVAAEMIVVMIVRSFAKLGKHMESFYDLLASVDKLGHLFDLPTEPHNKLFHLREGSPAAIKMHEVTFAHGKAGVLRSFQLALQPGESVALAGPPGCGKSTVVELLCGLRQPASGHIELDGIDLRELRPDSLREHLAVARSVEIFPGTIDENVHLNRPHISALDVREALAAVGLLDELLQLPDGLNTTLQTHGSPLSHSQATRLMLARAIVGRPRLLLIDGTLDTFPDDTLSTMLGNLIQPHSPWTLLVTTGRQAVMEACDRVVILRSGGNRERSRTERTPSI
jgi:putative ABC transport system ATP-binding protein